MIEHLQMVQRSQMEAIERGVEHYRRFPQTAKPKRRIARLRQLIAALI